MKVYCTFMKPIFAKCDSNLYLIERSGKQNVTFWKLSRYTFRNMKKEIIIGLSTILLVATPAFAAPGSDHGKSTDAKVNLGTQTSSEKRVEPQQSVLEVNDVIVSVTPIPSVTITVTPSTSPTPITRGLGQLKKVLGASVTPTQCDPNAQWKSHGDYVSCVAKTHPGGGVVSAAARSDVGKKHHGEEPSITPSVSPTGSPSATPTVSPTPPISSSEAVLGFSISPLETFIKSIGRFFDSLPFLHGNKHHK
jgi:hypothetical protein